jgi:uncharacterized protein YdhG (YjbR/CyaY superfamily)
MDSENYWKEIQLRAVIKASAPVAEERISYQIPTFTLKGNLVHFAAYKKHSGFYPTSSGIQAFKHELSIYEGANGLYFRLVVQEFLHSGHEGFRFFQRFLDFV